MTHISFQRSASFHGTTRNLKTFLWTSKKIVPNFLIEKNEDNLDLPTLLSGLKLVGDYLEKTILQPNNLSQPLSRIEFINTLK